MMVMMPGLACGSLDTLVGIPRDQLRLGWRHLLAIVRHFDPRPFEVFLCALGLIWAGWMLLHFDQNVHNFAMRGMLAVLPLGAWISIRMIACTIELYGVAVMHYRVRLICSFINCISWWLMAYSFVLSLFPTGAVPFLCVIASLQSWVVVRIAHTGERHD